MNKGEIWLVDLPSSDGREQSGLRPVTVLAETEVNIAIVLPFTSNLQALRFPHTFQLKPTKKNGLTALSVALIFQMRAIDKIRLKRKVGDLEDSSLKAIDHMIKKLLKLK